MRTIETEGGLYTIIIEPGEELLVRNAYTGALIRTVQNKGSKPLHIPAFASEVYSGKKIDIKQEQLSEIHQGGKEL